MDIVFFGQIAAAVFVGCCFFAAFAVALLKTHKHESAGGDPISLPWWVFFCVIIPLGMLAWMITTLV